MGLDKSKLYTEGSQKASAVIPECRYRESIVGGIGSPIQSFGDDRRVLFIKERIKKLQATLKNTEAYLIGDPAGIRYITGFDAKDVFIAAGAKKVFFFLPDMLISQFRQRFPDGKYLKLKDFPKEVPLLREFGIKTVIVNGNHISQHLAEKLKKLKKCNFYFSTAASKIDELRMIKDSGEIADIKKACMITVKTFNWIKSRIRPGMTETDISRLIKQKMIEFGADGIAFEPIVACGAHASMPHYQPGDSIISKSDAILLDFGCSCNGYNSDLTRMIYLGKIHELYRKINTIVSKAHNRAVKRIKPLVRASEIDESARSVIALAGYGDNFVHSLGHGVGLEIHEGPRLGPQSGDVLKAGMVVTVEPGIYLNGFGGVRREDTVLITNTGCKILTK